MADPTFKNFTKFNKETVQTYDPPTTGVYSFVFDQDVYIRLGDVPSYINYTFKLKAFLQQEFYLETGTVVQFISYEGKTSGTIYYNIEAIGLATEAKQNDIITKLDALVNDAIKGIFRTFGDAGATPANATGKTLLEWLNRITSNTAYCEYIRDDAGKGLMRSTGDAGTGPTNYTGKTLLRHLYEMVQAVDTLEDTLDDIYETSLEGSDSSSYVSTPGPWKHFQKDVTLSEGGVTASEIIAAIASFKTEFHILGATIKTPIDNANLRPINIKIKDGDAVELGVEINFVYLYDVSTPKFFVGTLEQNVVKGEFWGKTSAVNKNVNVTITGGAGAEVIHFSGIYRQVG